MKLKSILNFLTKPKRFSCEKPDPYQIFKRAQIRFSKNPSIKPPKSQTLENFLERQKLEKVISCCNKTDNQKKTSYVDKDQYQHHMQILELATVELVREISLDHRNCIPEISLQLDKGWIKAIINYNFDHALSPEDLSHLFTNLQKFKCILSQFGAKVELIHNLCTCHRPINEDQVTFLAYLPEKLEKLEKTKIKEATFFSL